MKTIILFAILSSAVCLSCINKRQQFQPEATTDKESAIIGRSDTVTSIQVSTAENDTILSLQTGDIDFPSSQSEIEKYESRIRMQRLPDVDITHADAYRIETQQLVYSPQTKQIVLDVINVDGPTGKATRL